VHGNPDRVDTDPACSDAPAPAAPAEDRHAETLRVEVVRAVRKVCPRWLADEAEDLAQITMTRVLGRVRATAGAVAYTPGYLYRAAHSALVDEIRRRRKNREVAVDPDSQAGPRSIEPDRQAKGREIREAITRCLAALHPPRRRAVMLHLQGHSFAETSTILGCARKRAENLVYRGLADLRACLAARGVEP
jgi:RNA polymerase sigma-70 factor (ECF subfamily)